jgi:hypothetical protein
MQMVSFIAVMVLPLIMARLAGIWVVVMIRVEVMAMEVAWLLTVAGAIIL